MAFSRRNEIHHWIYEIALPWWAEHGPDRRYGGYVEQMTMDGKDKAVPFKRTRVTARQIYAFSHAYILGFNRGAELALPGVEFLVAKTWNGADKGFARRLTQEGSPLDPTPDLYDIAFCLFAFSWFHAATGERSARDWLHRILDFVEGHMRHPKGGFLNQLPMPTSGLEQWRQQNPHMHLTEACLAAFEATGEKRFEEMARELLGLFKSKLFDPKSGTLGEYFTDDWSRAPGEDGQKAEPGHHLEWTWILNSARKNLGLDFNKEIRALATFAEGHGVDPKSHAVFNQVLDNGKLLDGGSRTWQNCERLKCAVALCELDGKDPTQIFEESAGLLLDRYLAHRPAGTWVDAFDKASKPVVDSIPASTLYHVFLAFSEVLRLCEEGRLG